MTTRFDVCLPFILKVEGGNDDDPDDPGGRTSRGIEQREYDAWCHLHNAATGDVWACSADTIAAIYLNQYWRPYTDQLPPGVDLMFFDTHVNEGLFPAVRFLQRAMKVEADGHFGVITAAAVRQITDRRSVILDIAAQRRNAYRGMSKFWKYGKGWLNRVSDCQAAALEMLDHG